MHDQDPAEGMFRTIFLGMASVAVSSVAVRLLSFGTHIALGWILAKDDFALWGIATSVGILVAGLRNAGTGQILIQEGSSQGERVRSIAQFAWLSSFVAAAILVMMAPIASWFFDDTEVVWLVLVMAGAVTISSPAIIHRARLSVDLRFREVALLDAVMSFSIFSSMVILAVAGLGAMAFAVAQVVGNLVAWTLYRRRAGPVPLGLGLTRERGLDIFRAAKWLITGAFATALAMSGDYLVVGRLARESLADYYFGFQLSLVALSLFGPAIQRVMLPSFVRLNDLERQVRAYERSIQVVVLAAAPVALSMAFLAPSLVPLIWAGKWDEAIPVIQIMAVSLLLPMLGQLSEALLQSRGMWSYDALLKLLAGVLIVVGAIIGTQIGGLVTIAVLVAIARSLVFPALVFFATQGTSVSAGEILRSVGARVLSFALLGGGLLVVVNVFPVMSEASWRAVLLNATMVLSSSLLLIRLLFPDDLSRITRMVRAAVAPTGS